MSSFSATPQLRRDLRVHPGLELRLLVDGDEGAADSFATVAAALPRRGVPIGTLIAAYALSLELTLVTNNSKHFKRVAGLRTENWV